MTKINCTALNVRENTSSLPHSNISENLKTNAKQKKNPIALKVEGHFKKSHDIQQIQK
jgi:hypothetical protein